MSLVPRPRDLSDYAFKLYDEEKMQLGADGWFIRDGDWVLVLPFRLDYRLQRVEGFDWWRGEPYASLMGGPICSVGAREMISVDRKGSILRSIIHLQRRFRQMRQTSTDAPGFWNFFFATCWLRAYRRRFWTQYTSYEGQTWWCYELRCYDGSEGMFSCAIEYMLIFFEG